MKTIFFLLLFSIVVLSAFPFTEAEWNMTGKTLKSCYPAEALADLEFFLLGGTGEIHLGVTKLNFNRKFSTVYLDKTIQSNFTGEINFNSSRFTILTSLPSAHDIPFDDQKRKETIEKYNLSGFVEIEFTEGTECMEEFIWEGTPYKKVVIKKRIEGAAKIIDRSGKLVFFDFIRPGVVDTFFYEIKITETIDGTVLNHVLLEHQHEAEYNDFDYSGKSVWDG